MKEKLKQEIKQEMDEKKKKRNKKIIIISIIVIAIIGIIIGIIIFRNNQSKSISSEYTKPLADSMADICLVDLKSRLKDPSSLSVNGKYAYYNESGTLQYIVIDASARNGFGGATRSYFVYTSYGSYVGTEEDSSVKKILNDSKYKVLTTTQEFKKDE